MQWVRVGRRRLLEIVILAVGVHLVLPQLAGLGRTGEQLARATWWLPLSVIALEAASVIAYGEMVRVIFRRDGEMVAAGLVQRAVAVGNSLGRALPAGDAAAFAVVTGCFRRAGVDGVTAGLAMGSAGLLSWAVLAALLPVGVVLVLATGHVSGSVVSAAGVAVVVLAGVGALLYWARDPRALADRAARLVRPVLRGPFARWSADSVALIVERSAEGVRRLATDRPSLVRGLGWAAANWLFDAAALAVLAVTIGHGTPLDGVLLAYVVGQLLATVPLTPGGVGIVEPAMVAVLVSAGAPAAAATVTVLGWRLASHWLPILAGLALLPTLNMRRSGQ